MATVLRWSPATTVGRVEGDSPQVIVKLAEEKFQEIQSAYAVVVESRS